MEIDPELLKKVMNDNSEFKKLYGQHSKLKSQVEELNNLKFMTAEQEVEKKQHQKEKLLMKDRLEKILMEYQSSSQ
jgi:uncharacterized protein YdcH (DUF465 family)